MKKGFIVHTYPFPFIVSIVAENAQVDQLNEKANAVDSKDQNVVFYNIGETIEHPEKAVENSAQVRIWLELLHRLVLNDSVKCWPVFIYSQIQTNKNNI